MKFICSIPAGTLRGAMKCAAVKDVRYYLQGVLLERCDGELYVVSTDGSRMFIANIRHTECAEQGNWSLIIPSELVKTSLKAFSKAAFINLHGDLSGAGPAHHIELRIGDTAFGGKSVDGRYPDWRRITPAPDAELDKEMTNYDPALLLSCHEALAEHNGVAKGKLGGAGFLYRLKGGCSVVVGTTPTAYCVLMARRDGQHDYAGWFKAPYPLKAAA